MNGSGHMPTAAVQAGGDDRVAMKKTILIHSIAIAIVLPLTCLAQEPNAPGKNGDAVKDPASNAPAREPVRTPSDAESGKNGDAVKSPDPAPKREFMGPITAVSREDKTITIDDAKMGSHKLHIGETTKLMHGDKPATWDHLKVGAKVAGTCTGGTDKAHAQTLTIKE